MEDRHFALFRERLRRREGGLADDPLDPGGRTDGGISSAFLERYNALHPEAGLPDDPARLSDAEKTALFRAEFYERPRIGALAALDAGLAEQVFDAGVLHGPDAAAEWLQTALNEVGDARLEVDGVLGPLTRAAVAHAVRRGLIAAVNNRMVALRLLFLRGLPTFHRFGRGWTRRAESFRTTVTV